MGSKPQPQKRTTTREEETRQEQNPWSPVSPLLEEAGGMAREMLGRGQFAANPYTGQRVAGFGDTTQQAQQMMLTRAQGGAPLIDAAQGTLSGMMQGQANPALEAVKERALASAVPAAAAQFSGAGMGNSTPAMDFVAQSAVDAVAPYEYDAFENAQGRAMQAARMAPGLEQAGYLPAQMMGVVGADRDALRQAQIDADMQRYYEAETQRARNFQNYLSTIMGLGKMGSTSTDQASGTTTTILPPQQRPSFMSRLGGGIATGIGTYGGLASGGVKGATPLGIAAGLAGLLQ